MATCGLTIAGDAEGRANTRNQGYGAHKLVARRGSCRMAQLQRSGELCGQEASSLALAFSSGDRITVNMSENANWRAGLNYPLGLLV